ncbi:hypothetical protein CEY09_20695 [Achromobacter marplatensis]|uniref:Regulatory protein, RpfE type n=1 Tax=Achromobacter marplatensis TaxID=470868 RepID=A0ABX9G7N8_9BURK|nr:hypothetical protein [Achromobacter marplatensis]OWT66120.1 hypothetical protein CEY09_20695 [Achromobacter marplatensis]RBP18492.1 hypothetical protein DFP87_10630 [Achromobacter marplatensis]CAB3662228.1 hypothetical protein LMG26219_03354 [Achromobacter marplatensis]
MLIVIPGALPALPVAAELAKLLPERAPTLHSWLLAGAARSVAFDVRAHGCTAFESWQLTRAGYTPEPGLLQGAGLGPLLAAGQAPAGDAVWLAELVHLALGADQANLLDPGQMDLLPEETAALLDTARPLFEGTGFAVDALSPQRWRLRLPDGLRPQTASPQVVAGQRLNEWWRQDTETRPWRRLLNEIQMAWHEHPVNDARAARGLAPVNALWLYGGGTPWPIAPAGPERVLTGLDAPQRTGDWSAWLDALAELDAQHLRPLAGKKGVPDTATELLLLGDDRKVALTLKPRGGLLGLLPAPKKNWSAWWSHPA